MKNRTITTTLVAATALLALADAASAYYSPRLGRFLSRDPINEPGAVLVRQAARPASSFIPRDPIRREEPRSTPYTFVNNRPVDQVDPLGLEALFQTILIEILDNRGSIGATIHVTISPPPTCRLVRWVQMYREQKWAFWKSDTGWKVDSSSWYGLPPYLPWYTTDIDGPNPTGGGQRWTLRDEPGLLWRDFTTQGLTQDFETCAVCVRCKGRATRGCVLGCVTWGHSWVKGDPDFHTWYGDGAQPTGPSWRVTNVLLQFGAMWNGFPIANNCSGVP